MRPLPINAKRTPLWGGLLLLCVLGWSPAASAYWVDVQASIDGGKTFSDTSPSILSGKTAKIRWKSSLPTTVSSTVANCKVWSAPTPPSDSWWGLSGTKPTGAITQHTTYTAECAIAGTVVAKDTIVLTIKPLTATSNQLIDTSLVWSVDPLTASAWPGMDGPVLTTQVIVTNLSDLPLSMERIYMQTHLLSDGRVRDREERVEDVSLLPHASASQLHETSCRELGGCEIQTGAACGTDGVETKCSLAVFGLTSVPLNPMVQGLRGALGRMEGYIRGSAAPQLMANALVAASSTTGTVFPRSEMDCASAPCPVAAVPQGAPYEVRAIPQGSYSVFKEWHGWPCDGLTAETCSFTASSAVPSLTAVFDVLDGNIDVEITGDGAGRVYAQGALSDDIDCPSDCSATLPQGTTLTLAADADGGIDVDWTGCNAHTSTTCTVNVTGSYQTIRVEFDAPESKQLGDVSGNGVVTAFDALLILHSKGILQHSSDFPDVEKYFEGRSRTLNEQNGEYARADVTGDGDVSVSDANFILRYSRGCHARGTSCDDDNPYDFALGTVGAGPHVTRSPVRVLVESFDGNPSMLSSVELATDNLSVIPILDYCDLRCGFIRVSEADSWQIDSEEYAYVNQLTPGYYFDGVFFADTDGRILPGNYDPDATCNIDSHTRCQINTDTLTGDEDEYPARIVFVKRCPLGVCNSFTALAQPAQITALSTESETASLPDLIVSSAMYSPPLIKQHSVVSLGAVVHNLRSTMSTPTTATLKVFQKVNGVWGATPIATLPAKPVSGLGQFAPAVVEWREQWIASNPGTYKFEVCVDPGAPGAVREESETNNCRVLETRTETLAVQNLQPSMGTIVSDAETSEPDIACGSACSKSFSAFSRVTLRANPVATAAFDGWMSGPPRAIAFTVHSRQCPGTEPYTTAVWATDRQDWTWMSCGGAGAYLTLKLPAPARIRQIQYLPPVAPTTVDHHRQILDILIRERFARFVHSQRANSILASLPSPDTQSWASYFNLWPDDLAEVAQQLSEGKSIQPLTDYYGRRGRLLGQFYSGDPLWASAKVLVSGSKSAGIKVELVDSSQWLTDPKQQVPQIPVTLPFRYAKAADMAGTVFEASVDGSTWTFLQTIGGPPAGDYRWRTITLAAGAPPFQYMRMKNPSGKLVASEVVISGESLPAPGGVCGQFGAHDCPLLLSEPTTVYGGFGKLGDVVPDGTINVSDALCILRIAVGLPPSPSCTASTRANTNKDPAGEITSADALCALRNAVGLTPLPCTGSTSSLKVAQVGEGRVTVSNISGGTLAQLLSNANAMHGLLTLGPTPLPTGAAAETLSMTVTPATGTKLVSITGCNTLVGTTCTVTVNAAKQVTITTFVPQVAIVTPNGGQTVTENTTFAVKWTQNYTPTSGAKLSVLRASDNVNLGIIKACGTAGVATGAANEFKFVWLVGRNSTGALMSLVGGGKYKLRVTDCATGLLDDSNAAFTYKK